jgi:hypothetical protein
MQRLRLVRSRLVSTAPLTRIGKVIGDAFAAFVMVALILIFVQIMLFR